MEPISPPAVPFAGRRCVGGFAVLAILLVLSARADGQEALSVPEGLTPDAIRNASTAEEHRAIADAYGREATALRAQAEAHRAMPYPPAQARTGRGRDAEDRRSATQPATANLAFHCRILASKLDEAARAADALAQAHRMMAGAGRPDAGASPDGGRRDGRGR